MMLAAPSAEEASACAICHKDLPDHWFARINYHGRQLVFCSARCLLLYLKSAENPSEVPLGLKNYEAPAPWSWADHSNPIEGGFDVDAGVDLLTRGGLELIV